MIYSNLDEFMKERDCKIIFGDKCIYYEEGEWVVCERKSVGSRWIVLDRFLDVVQSSLEQALTFMDTGRIE